MKEKVTVEITGLPTDRYRAALAVVRARQIKQITRPVGNPIPLPISWPISPDLWGFKLEWVSLELAGDVIAAASTPKTDIIRAASPPQTEEP